MLVFNNSYHYKIEVKIYLNQIILSIKAMQT